MDNVVDVRLLLYLIKSFANRHSCNINKTNHANHSSKPPSQTQSNKKNSPQATQQSNFSSIRNEIPNQLTRNVNLNQLNSIEIYTRKHAQVQLTVRIEQIWRAIWCCTEREGSDSEARAEIQYDGAHGRALAPAPRSLLHRVHPV